MTNLMASLADGLVRRMIPRVSASASVGPQAWYVRCYCDVRLCTDLYKVCDSNGCGACVILGGRCACG